MIFKDVRRQAIHSSIQMQSNSKDRYVKDRPTRKSRSLPSSIESSDSKESLLKKESIVQKSPRNSSGDSTKCSLYIVQLIRIPTNPEDPEE